MRECTRDGACAHCGQRKSHHRCLCNQLFQQTTEVQNISNIDEVEGTTAGAAELGRQGRQLPTQVSTG